MQTTNISEAAEQLAEYLPEGRGDVALRMARLAVYIAGDARGVPICTTGKDGAIVSVVCDRGWLKI